MDTSSTRLSTATPADSDIVRRGGGINGGLALCYSVIGQTSGLAPGSIDPINMAYLGPPKTGGSPPATPT